MQTKKEVTFESLKPGTLLVSKYDAIPLGDKITPKDNTFEVIIIKEGFCEMRCLKTNTICFIEVQYINGGFYEKT